jgi:hypothetical protein
LDPKALLYAGVDEAACATVCAGAAAATVIETAAATARIAIKKIDFT